MFRSPALLVVLVHLSVPAAWGQDALLAEARGYLDQGSCEEATRAARRSLHESPTAEGHWIVGHCLFERRELDSARIALEQALELDGTLADAVFDLGLVEQYARRAEPALAHFRRYAELEPNDLSGPTQEAFVLMDLQEDLPGAEAVLSECLRRDPKDAPAQYYMAICLRRQDRDAEALVLLDQATSDHPDDPDFTILRALWAREDGDRAAAAVAWEQAYRATRKVVHAQRAGFDRVLARTTPEAIRYREDGSPAFTTIGVGFLAAMDSAIGRRGSKTHADSLLARWRNDPAGMGLDEVYLTYYSGHISPSYSPYATDARPLLRPLQQEGRYAELLAAADGILADHPCNLEALRARAVALHALERDQEFLVAILRYEALMQSLLATGSGTSMEEAIPVMNVRDEYVLLGYQGLDVRGQALLSDGGLVFDRMECQDEEGNEVTWYFEISKPFASLGRAFDQEDGNGKKGRSKKRDKER